MDLTKLSLYIEIGQISIIAVMTFYLAPVNLLIGEYQNAVGILIFSTLYWVLAWKFNNTLHQLLDKWKEK